MEPVELKFIISGNVDSEIKQYIKAMKGVETGAKNSSTKAKSYLAGIGKSGGTIGKTFAGGFSSFLNPATLGIGSLSAILLKFGKNAYQFSKDFNAGMLEVKTISQATKEDFDGISDSVLNLSRLPIKDTGVELSKAYYQIVSAGYDGAEGLKVLEASAKAATGGVTETKIAADGLTTVLNAWGKTADDVNDVSDKMFTTVRLGKTTMGELSASIAQVAPLASSMGVSMDEVFAATASLTKQGVPTAEAMTQIRASLLGLNENLGDGWSKTMTYQEALKKVMDMAGGSQNALKNMMGRVEGVNAVLAMTGDKAAGAAQDLEDLRNSTGAAGEAFKTMSEDVDIKWQQVTNKWNANLKNVGGAIKEMSAGLADFLNAALTQSGDEKLDENTEVSGFTDRMKMARNAGLSFFEALTAATLQGDEAINSYVDNAIDKGNELLKAKNDDIERFQREITSKTAGKDEDAAKAIIASEIEKYKELITQDNELLQQLEGSTKSKDVKIRINTKKELPTFQNYIKELETMLQNGGKTAKLDLPVKPVLPNISEQIQALNQEIANKQSEITTLRLPSSLATGADISSAEKELKDLKSQLETLTGKKLEKEVEFKTVPGTIDRLDEELKKLQDKSGTFTNAKAENDNLEAILLKTEELEAAWQKVRDVRAKAMGVDGSVSTPELKAKETPVAALDPKRLDESLAPMKLLTAEELKQLKATKERLDVWFKLDTEKIVNVENLKEFAGILGEASTVIGSMSDLAGVFNEELAKSLDNISEMAGQAASFTASLASGDWIGAITNGIGLVVNIIETLKKTDEVLLSTVEQSKRLREIYAQIEEITQSILADSINLGLSDEYRLKILNEAIESYNDTAGSYVDRRSGEMTTKLDYLFSELERLRTLMAQPGISEERWNVYNEQLQEVINDIGDIQDSYVDMLSTMEEIAGVAGDTLTNNIVNGLLNGMQLAKDGLGDFAQSFGEMMQQSGTEYLRNLFESQYLIALMEQFATMASDGLTPEEMSAFEEQYRAAIEQFQPVVDAWNATMEGFGLAVDTPENGLQGSIQNITEQTAGALEGSVNAMLFKIVDLGDIQSRQLAALYEIATNTSYNYHLEDMADDIIILKKEQVSTNTILKEIRDKSTNAFSL
jgi:TP901 family phage tail tape measure protein